MPIFEVHLVAGRHAPARHAELLRALSARYAEVLDSPIERVRGYVTLHEPEHWARARRARTASSAACPMATPHR